MRKRTQPDRIISEDDFACLVDAHQHRLHVYLVGLTGQPEQAFDLVQETFYDAWQAACKGKPPFVAGTAEADIRRWLYRVATNNALSLLRHHRLIHWEPLDDHVELLPDARTPFDEHLAESDILRAAHGGWIITQDQNQRLGIIAIGIEKHTILPHYDGTSWKEAQTPDAGGDASAVTGMSFAALPDGKAIQDSDVPSYGSPMLWSCQNGGWTLYQQKRPICPFAHLPFSPAPLRVVSNRFARNGCLRI